MNRRPGSYKRPKLPGGGIKDAPLEPLNEAVTSAASWTLPPTYEAGATTLVTLDCSDHALVEAVERMDELDKANEGACRCHRGQMHCISPLS